MRSLLPGDRATPELGSSATHSLGSLLTSGAMVVVLASRSWARRRHVG